MNKPKFKMNARSLLVSCIALFAILSVFTVSASELVGNNPDELQINFNGMRVKQDSTAVLSAFAGERIPLEVFFVASEDEDDVRVKAEISGLREDIEAKTSRFEISTETACTKANQKQ